MADIDVLEGDGAVTVVVTVAGQNTFDFDFLAYLGDTVKVVFRSGQIGEAPLTFGVDYTVAGLAQAAGGSITLAGAYAGISVVGDKVLMYRSTPIRRLFDYQNAGDFRADTVNREFDTMIMIDQELRRDLARSFKAPIGSDPLDLTITVGADETVAMWDGGNLVEGPSVADINAAEGNAQIAVDAAATALAVAAGVSLPPVAANRMLVDNAAGTLRESKTFAQVRSLLQVPQFSDLPWVLAWENGVPGDGTNQLAALQAIVNALPSTGGAILLRGDVYLGTTGQLDLSGKHNILIAGLPGGGNGTGSAQRTMLRSGHGAIGGNIPVINCRSTFNVSFENLFIYNNNAAFNGTLVCYGSRIAVTPGQDSALMTWKNIFFSLASGTGYGLQLHGSTQGLFESCTFSARGQLVSMQQVAGVGFVNVHKFVNCNFKPTGTEYPVSGSGEGILFLGCNVQASSGDGIGRFWRTSLTQPFRGISLIGCTFYDANTPGGIWAEFYWGQGLVIQGCGLGGVDPSLGSNYGFSLGQGGAGLSEPGVRGFSILGNNFRYVTAAISFGGTAAADTNAKKGIIGGNSVFGGSSPASNLISSITETRDVVFLPNNINSLPNAIGSHFNMRGLPTAATGLVTGDVWSNANILTIVP